MSYKKHLNIVFGLITIQSFTCTFGCKDDYFFFDLSVEKNKKQTYKIFAVKYCLLPE